MDFSMFRGAAKPCAAVSQPLEMISQYIAGALDAFVAAEAAAVNGGVVLTATKNDKRAILVGLMRELASYVQVTCKGDLTVLLSSGFPIQKPQRNPIGTLPAPANLTVTLGMQTGELERRWHRCSARPSTTGASARRRLRPWCCSLRKRRLRATRSPA
jgi:hypothetical protein